MHRQRFFSFFRKQTFCGQLIFQLLIGLHQVAGAFSNQQASIKLVHTVPLIDADTADSNNCIPVVGIFGQVYCLPAEHNAF